MLSETFSPFLSTGEDTRIVIFRPAPHLSTAARRSVLSSLLALCVTAAGGTGTAYAHDGVAIGEGAHTSWAASVQAALSRRVHKVASWTQHGVASWYGQRFHGRRTSSGEMFDLNGLTAAHPSLPIGTKLLVTSQDTGRSVVVTVNDRGPFNSRIIDLSQAAAARIGMLGKGTAHVILARLPEQPPKTNMADIEVAEAEPEDTSAQAIANAAPQAVPLRQHAVSHVRASARHFRHMTGKHR